MNFSDLTLRECMIRVGRDWKEKGVRDLILIWVSSSTPSFENQMFSWCKSLKRLLEREEKREQSFEPLFVSLLLFSKWEWYKPLIRTEISHPEIGSPLSTCHLRKGPDLYQKNKRWKPIAWIGENAGLGLKLSSEKDQDRILFPHFEVVQISSFIFQFERDHFWANFLIGARLWRKKDKDLLDRLRFDTQNFCHSHFHQTNGSTEQQLDLQRRLIRWKLRFW